MREMTRVPFSLHGAMVDWQFSPFSLLVVALLIGAALWYLRADWRLAARGRRWGAKRTASFMCGLLAVDLALQSPIATYTGTYFQAHVVQHLLLMVVAPPLLAMGAPMTLAMQTSTRSTKSKLLAVLNSRPFQVLTHPVPVWFLYYFFMFAFFLTFVLGYAMSHMWVMDLINVAFLLAATLFWWPVVGLDPIPHWKLSHGARMTNLFIGIPVESFLGLALLSSARPAAPMYSLASTHAGGALLWIGAELFTFAALLPIFIQWMRADERQARRYDARLEAAMAADRTPSTRDTELRGDPAPPSWRSQWLPATRADDSVA